MSVKNIIKGNIKRLTGQNSELVASRTVICRECPVSKNKNGGYSGWCRVKNGGCGCPLKSKAAEETEECPKGKWVEIQPQEITQPELNETQTA